MTSLRAIVVDDERLARRGLALRLQDMAQVDVIGECVNGQEALQSIATESPDLVFLDIQMPGINGFDVVRELQADAMPLIIFVTAFDEYAVEAFRIHAVDYLLKPIDVARLEEAIDRAVGRFAQAGTNHTKKRLMELMDGMGGAAGAGEMLDEPTNSPSWPERLTIKDGNEFQFIRIGDIQWIDAAGDYMCVHADGKTHIMRTTMKQLEAMLNPDTFLRVHRSSIVNINSITGARTHANGEYLLALKGGARLKVSRGYRDKIKPLLNP